MQTTLTCRREKISLSLSDTSHRSLSIDLRFSPVLIAMNLSKTAVSLDLISKIGLISVRSAASAIVVGSGGKGFEDIGGLRRAV